MPDTDLKSLEKRLATLESKFGSKTSDKPKKIRKKSEYNIFVQKYISGEKKKNSSLSHKELFSAAAKEWTSLKK